MFWCYRNPELLDECDIDSETKEVLLDNIKRRLTPQSVKIRSGKSDHLGFSALKYDPVSCLYLIKLVLISLVLQKKKEKHLA